MRQTRRFRKAARASQNHLVLERGGAAQQMTLPGVPVEPSSAEILAMVRRALEGFEIRQMARAERRLRRNELRWARVERRAGAKFDG